MLVCILRISSKVAVWVRDIFGPSHSQTSLGRTRLDNTHTAVWRQGLLSRLKIENLIDQNHLKPSSFILVGKLDTVTSVCIFQLQEDTHTFSSPKFPILQPHHMPVQVQILFRWPELKFLCLYFSFPMNHWKEIPKPFFFLVFWFTVPYTTRVVFHTCLKEGGCASCLPTVQHKNVFHASHCWRPLCTLDKPGPMWGHEPSSLPISIIARKIHDSFPCWRLWP